MQGIDFFSGAGGMSTGAVAAGVDVRYAVELDFHAANTFATNHPGTKILNKDIRTVSASDFKSLSRRTPTIILGGPPCQGFSTSNQKTRGHNNQNNWLFQEYLRLVGEIRPDWVVFENVKGLVETANGYFLDAVLQGFHSKEYTTSHFLLNSADYGVPQKRNRLFIIASLHGISVDKPEATTAGKHVTVCEAISDLPSLESGASVCEKSYSRRSVSNYARFLRGGLTKCSNNVVTGNAAHVIERYKYIPQGGNWENIPKSLMNNYADVSRCHTGIYRRLKEDEPSVVIGNFRKNMLIHPSQDRGLSVREAARLQSFPDSFRFLGSIGFQQQQVGNAVPPLLAQAVFQKIISSS